LAERSLWFVPFGERSGPGVTQRCHHRCVFLL